MNAKQLQKFLDAAGLSQRGAARELGISERNMRRYVAGELPIPRVIELALMTRVVGIDELTDGELNSFTLATDAFRAAMPRQGFFHTDPVREASGKLREFRMYDKEKLLGVVPIGLNGKPKKVTL